MQIRHANPTCESGNFGSIPGDWEENWSVAQNAEVIRIVSVFPDVLAGKNKIFANRLRPSRVKLVTPSRAQRSRLRR